MKKKNIFTHIIYIFTWKRAISITVFSQNILDPEVFANDMINKGLMPKYRNSLHQKTQYKKKIT